MGVFYTWNISNYKSSWSDITYYGACEFRIKPEGETHYLLEISQTRLPSKVG